MDDDRRSPSRPALLLLATFLAFFLGLQAILDSVWAIKILVLPQSEDLRNELLDSTAFSLQILSLLLAYQLISGLLITLSAYFLLTQLRESARWLLKVICSVDVLLSLAILLYYWRVEYRPPSPQLFYYNVVCTMLEIGVIVFLSHASIVGLTQGQVQKSIENKS